MFVRLVFPIIATLVVASPTLAVPREQKAAQRQAGRQVAYQNAHLARRSDRINAARKMLGVPIDNAKRRAIHEAHAVGIGKAGQNARYVAGINPNGTHNFTPAQIAKKVRILRKAGFTKEQVRKLMDYGITGTYTFYANHKAVYLSMGQSAAWKVAGTVQRDMPDVKINAISQYDRRLFTDVYKLEIDAPTEAKAHAAADLWERRVIWKGY